MLVSVLQALRLRRAPQLVLMLPLPWLLLLEVAAALVLLVWWVLPAALPQQLQHWQVCLQQYHVLLAQSVRWPVQQQVQPHLSLLALQVVVSLAPQHSHRARFLQQQG